MPNLPLFFGLIAAGITGVITYWRKRNWEHSIIYGLIAFLSIGTPAHFIVVSALTAVIINKLLIKYVKKNWAAFLLSIPGFMLVVLLLLSTANFYLPLSVSGPMNLGAGLATGIGLGLIYILAIFAGAATYLITLLMISLMRTRKPLKKSARKR